MSKTKKFFLIFVVLPAAILIILATSRPRPDSIVWERDYEESLKIAQSHQQPIIAYLFTDWCGYCKQMEATTFVNPSVIDDMGDRYVWLRLNAETENDGILVHKKFGITSYPTVLILDHQGAEIDRLEGYFPPDRFQKTVDNFIRSSGSLGKLTEKAEKQPDSVQAQYDLAEKYLQRRDFGKAGHRLSRVIALDPDNRYGMTESSHYYLALSLASEEKNEAALEQLDQFDSRFPDSDLQADATLLRGQIYYYYGDATKARKVLSTYLESHPDHGYANRARQLLAEIGP